MLKQSATTYTSTANKHVGRLFIVL